MIGEIMSKIKSNKIQSSPIKKQILIFSIFSIIVLGAAYILVSKLYHIWLEQCIVRNYAEQIEVTGGNMIKSELIVRACGLTNGINLATLDYESLRKKTLTKFPQLKSITFSYQMPCNLKVTLEERTPIVRIGISGKHTNTGLVADEQGYIFRKYPNTSTLPVIKKSSIADIIPGKQLEARAMAAIRLLEAFKNPEFVELAALVADISKKDFIVVTFKSDYSQAKIAWADIDIDSPASKANMHRQITHLLQAMRIKTGTRLWNATDTSIPGKIHAEPRGTTDR
jgi:hypothetical protein